MSRKFNDVRSGKKAMLYGSVNAIGPLSNPRHPRKFKPDKKTAPGECYDSIATRYGRLTPENRGKFDAMVTELLEEQKTAPSAANTESGKEAQHSS